MGFTSSSASSSAAATGLRTCLPGSPVPTCPSMSGRRPRQPWQRCWRPSAGPRSQARREKRAQSSLEAELLAQVLGMAPEPDAYRREEALRAGAEQVLTMTASLREVVDVANRLVGE